MELADFDPDEVVNWIERLEKDGGLMRKTLEKALDDVPIIEYWVRTHLAGRENGISEELLLRIKDLVNLLLALYSIERQQKN
jgi:hypothetical protein